MNEVRWNMSDEFKPENYRDKYRERVQAMLDEKSKGREITVAAPEAPRHGQIIDLMQALKQSIEKAKPKQQPHRRSASGKPPRKLVIIPLSSARLSNKNLSGFCLLPVGILGYESPALAPRPSSVLASRQTPSQYSFGRPVRLPLNRQGNCQ